jgi:predicted ABC-type transport system involved in lysophospholipase L1 biosynthesis ATPase subunit
VLVTHDRELASRCERIIEMEAGHVIDSKAEKTPRREAR